MIRKFLPLAFLTGCLSEATFPDQLTLATCSRSLECDKAAFEASWDDVGECVDDNASNTQTLADCLVEAGCVYNAEKAKTCLSDIRTADCGDVTSGAATSECLESYECDLLDLVDAGLCFVF